MALPGFEEGVLSSLANPLLVDRFSDMCFSDRGKIHERPLISYKVASPSICKRRKGRENSFLMRSHSMKTRSVSVCDSMQQLKPNVGWNLYDEITMVMERGLALGFELMSNQGSLSNFFQNLNSTQYQQLMTMLPTHLASSSKSINELQPTTAASFTIGTYFSVTLSEVFSSPQYWIVDSRATRHICSIASAFISLHHIKNSIITLPNHTKIPVSLAGDVQINTPLILKDVLFVPAFKFNLLSVSALTFGTKLTVQFISDHFEIQELCSQKMIGMELVLPLSTSSVVHFTSLTSPFISLHPESEANPPLVVAPREFEILISNPVSMPYTDVVDVSPTQSPLDSHIDHHEETIPHDHNIHLKRSSRVPQPPSYLRDFHCSLVSQQDVSSPVCSTAYPLNKRYGSLGISSSFLSSDGTLSIVTLSNTSSLSGTEKICQE
ncbi:hypothetical protein LWI28_024264 [Acer negundo]|uniref:Retrovirus-related Pol polyprotein from transposon TNT 1-94-like beta-barrel domain-containing protein n=1 Tax=Acer negundo TaxID=4023 RepID=A0AAD5IGZ2_ACENE|nr:hypothetical protein LWI28_024264 [Acer negundo]